MDKYGTRLCNKITNRSQILAIVNPKMLEDNYIISKNKDAGKREKFIWKSADKEWVERVKNIWWFKKEKTENIDNKMYELRDKLLSFGGNAVVLPAEDEDVDEILNNGQFWFGSGAKKMRGLPSQCHYNSCKLYEKNCKEKDIRICTGYALSSDGLWRQHSWCVWHKPASNTIVETTEPRIAYFGFVMIPKQCEEFCYYNC